MTEQHNIAKPAADFQHLITVMSAFNIYYFRYFPKKKLVLIPEDCCKYWHCPPVVENAPESLCDAWVSDTDRERFKELFRVIDEGAPSASSVVRLKDQTWQRFSLCTVVRDEEGRPEECITVLEDYSEAKRTEQEIIEHEAALDQALQVFQLASAMTDSIVFLYDIARQSILVSGDTAEQWGVLQEQLGVPYEIADSGIVLESSKAEYIRLHEEMIHGASKVSGTVQMRDIKGHIAYYELTLQALLDKNGNPTGKAAGIYKNVTAFQEHYLHQFQMTKALSEGVAIVFYVDLEHDSYVIESVADDYRKLRADVIALLSAPETRLSKAMDAYCRTFVHEDDLNGMLHELNIRTIREKLAARSSYYVQFRIRTAVENRGYYEMHVSEDDRERGCKAFISFRNIDDQKEKDFAQHRALTEAYYAANRANSAKSVFMSQMSHDIRTPLNAIMGMTSIAKAQANDPDKVISCLNKINESSGFLLDLVNEVLDMNRIESGDVRLDLESFSLTGLIDRIESVVTTLAAEKKHSFSVHMEQVKHTALIGDKKRIEQCLMNLTGNAIKYTPEGGTISLTVRERTTNRPRRGCFEFEVRDDGIGIDPAFLPKLFEPFTRSDDVRAWKQQGTGLGLSITRTIVQMMNGDIQVESEPDKGSKFTATIFLELQDGPSEGERNSTGTGAAGAAVRPDKGDELQRFAESDFHGRRILLAEDNAINAEIAMEIMSGAGLVIDHVWNGADAVRRLSEVEDGYYGLVFMDIQMPGMNGYQATRLIRESDRIYLRELPIIAMSANAFAEDVQAAKKSGMQDHVSKPLDFDRLLTVLRTWLQSGAQSDGR